MMNYNKRGGTLLTSSSDELAGLHIAIITHPEDESLVVGGACFSLIKRTKRSGPEDGYLALAMTLFAILPRFERQGAGARLFAEIRAFAVAQKAAQFLILSAQPADDNSWWVRRLQRADLETEPCVNLDNTGTRESTGAARTLLQVLKLPEKLPNGLWIPWDLDNKDIEVVLIVDVNTVKTVIEKERRAAAKRAPVRPLKMVELCAGSCRVTKQARLLRWDGHAYERDGTRPEWDEAEDEAAGQAPLPKSAVTVGELMELQADQIRAADFVWLSPSCTSTTNIAQSTHRRTEENDYDGETVEAADWNRVVERQANFCVYRKMKSPAFAYILEQPVGQARLAPALIQRFEKESSELRSVRCTVHMCAPRNCRLKPWRS